MPAEEGLGRDRVCRSRRTRRPRRVACAARRRRWASVTRRRPGPSGSRRTRFSFLERVNDVTRLLVDPARDGHDEELQHVGKRRHTGRAEQRLSAVTNVATRRASSVESARRTASIGFLDSTRWSPGPVTARGQPLLDTAPVAFDLGCWGPRHRAAVVEVCSFRISAPRQGSFAASRGDNLRCDRQLSRTVGAVGEQPVSQNRSSVKIFGSLPMSAIVRRILFR